MRQLYALLVFAGVAWGQGTPVDCTPGTFTFVAAATGSTVNNLNTATPCRSWEVTYDAPSTISVISIQFETSQDGSTWAAVPNNICSSSQQPPCVIDGANPSSTTLGATFSVSAYGKFVRLNVTTLTGTGTLTARMYGYKGLSARVRSSGGGGGGGGMTVAGTTNQVAVSGTCNDSAGTCTLALPNASVTINASTGNFSTPGTVSTGAGGGTSGQLTLTGSSSGSAAITVAAVAGTPNALVLPTATAAGSSYVLQSNGGSPQQLSYAPPAGTGADVVRATAAGVTGNCMQWAAAGAGDSGSPCGTGSGGSGSTLFSTTNSTTVTATVATTLIGTVTGSTTVAANTFTAGSVMEFMGQGFYTSTGSRTLNIQMLIGGSARISTGAVTVPGATNGTWLLRCDVTTRTTGVSGTQIANCVFFATGATLTAPAAAPMQTSATWTLDTTSTAVLDLQATWDATTGAPTITSSNVAAWFNGAGAGSSGITTSTTITPNSASSAPAAAVPVTGWTLQNTANTANSVNDFYPNEMVMTSGNFATTQWSALTRTVSVPYTIIAMIQMRGSIQGATNVFVSGVTVSDGTKYEHIGIQLNGGSANVGLEIRTLSTLGVAGTVITGPTTAIVGPTLAVKIVNNSTNRIWSYWSHGAWVQFLSEASGTFLTETAAGIDSLCDIPSGGFACDTALRYWSVQ